MKELIIESMQAQYRKNGDVRVMNELKKVFCTDDIIFNIGKIPNDINKNLLIIPIEIRKNAYGYYLINNYSNVSNDDINLINSVLNQMYTNILINYRNNTNGLIDIDTETYNRNYFEVYKKAYPLENFSSVTCVFIDINGLHEINNTYGHDKGDEVIFKTASTIKKYFNNDKVFRIGGDEFVVMVTDNTEEYVINGIKEVVEILRKKDIFVATGYTYSKEKVDISVLIKSADEKMYKNKKNFYSKNDMNLR